MKVTINPTKLHGTIQAIPSKSHAHRVLIAQKLARLQGQAMDSPLQIPSFSKDIEATKMCLSALDVINSGSDSWPHLDCGESGSTIRFMIPVAMVLCDKATFIGSGKLPERPLSPLREEMEAHGCNFNMTGNTWSPAVAGADTADGANERLGVEICTIEGRLQPGAYKLAGNISSQFITGLLFALPLLDGDSTLELTTKLESAGYVDLSMDVLRAFGIEINENANENGFIVYNIRGRQKYIEPEGMSIQGDWSNAAFWLACGVLGDGIRLTGLDIASSQRDKMIVSFLESMGAEISIDGDIVTAGKSARLKAQTISVAQTPDVVPVLAAVMATAEGTSHIVDAQRLKIKESDRLKTVCEFLTRLGADVKISDSSLTICGRETLSGGSCESYNDHRIAMALATAACACEGPVTIIDAQAVSKSYPDFFADYALLGGHVAYE